MIERLANTHKSPLRIIPADDDGFVVVEDYRDLGCSGRFLFAGTLPATMSYLQARLTAPPILHDCAQDDAQAEHKSMRRLIDA